MATYTLGEAIVLAMFENSSWMTARQVHDARCAKMGQTDTSHGTAATVARLNHMVEVGTALRKVDVPGGTKYRLTTVLPGTVNSPVK